MITANTNKKPIKVDRFAEHLAKFHANMNEQFGVDYESIVPQADYTYHAAKLEINMNKNRYKNILACKPINFVSFVSMVISFQMITQE